MCNFDFVFSDEQYKLLSDGYKNIFTPNLSTTSNALNNTISLLEIQGFGMPLNLQNSIRNLLIQSYEILNILHKPQTHTHQPLNYNPFGLINALSQISINLNQFQPHTTYQALAAKANNLILQAINKISKHFQNKSI